MPIIHNMLWITRSQHLTIALSCYTESTLPSGALSFGGPHLCLDEGQCAGAAEVPGTPIAAFSRPAGEGFQVFFDDASIGLIHRGQRFDHYGHGVCAEAGQVAGVEALSCLHAVH